MYYCVVLPCPSSFSNYLLKCVPWHSGIVIILSAYYPSINSLLAPELLICSDSALGNCKTPQTKFQKNQNRRLPINKSLKNID